jgi:hypothetical protein
MLLLSLENSMTREEVIAALIEKGWQILKSGRGSEGKVLVPPDSLWANKPEWFYYEDAAKLQNLLGETLK